MFQIVRKFELAYAHRLWGYAGKCRRLHGHNAMVEVVLSAESIDESGFVRDFSELQRQLGSWLDTHWDHRTFLCQTDPLAEILRQAGEEIVVFQRNPTCETFAQSLFETAVQLGLPVCSVRFYENTRNGAEYRPISGEPVPMRRV
ncbi:MAG: 6-carboxytetrahydropterin synthase [Thermoguttaceae bacterium]|nr:6-carboxytetrahydropterin synthase [Thermoguttaceae bacterium]